MTLNHILRNYSSQPRFMGCPKRRMTSNANEFLSGSHPSKRRFGSPRMRPLTTKNDEITLNQAESKLCKLLHQCSLHLKSSAHPDLDSLTLRIAGGWVRDKLLGVESNDLDIAISSLTGQDFAIRFSTYLQEQQQQQSPGKQADQQAQEEEEQFELGKIATIEARPDQSKHLETATSTFLGLDLDFVQLRSEEYGDQDSRIPSNVGLADLEAGVVRTPLPAEHTFKDDPLRLLRCIRFATRFGFQLDPDIICAAKSEPIRVALKEKISRERVGTEVDKMLKGRDPLSSLKMIEELGLYQLVFSPPVNLPADTSLDSSVAIRAAEWLDRLLHRSDINTQDGPKSFTDYRNISQLFPRSIALSRRLFFACALLPYRFIKCKSGKKDVWAGELVLMDSLKLGHHDKNFISRIFQSLEILNVGNLESILSTTTSSSVRVELGRLLRLANVHDLKQAERETSVNWHSSLVFALVIELSNLHSDPHQLSFTDQELAIVKSYDQLVEIIFQMDLPFVVTPEFEKRRLDGKEICQVLGTKPGRHLGEIIERVVDRQIEHPEQTKEEGAKWLEEQLHAGLIKLS
ncbi:hypothetical protein VP01_1805g7 [Puccinia sorghi]|uniref:Poly A polymerase head domain-containing protein n=1 Tax=Puccinia sorghi TaxID=27349 RepID=A0A0L6VE57_9BASI|nr:hypothetical protein VP01_1805g7 [Puccinia sorghi]